MDGLPPTNFRYQAKRLVSILLFVNRISKATRIVSALFIFAATTSHSEIEAPDQTGPFLVLPDTTSPDGHYAVAWGLPKHPEIWAEVRHWERDHPPSKEGAEDDSKQAKDVFEKVASVAEDVENYLVDLREGKIIHMLARRRTPGVLDRSLEPDYYVAAEIRPNRHGLEVVWSKAGDLVLVNHTYRWDCVMFCAVPMIDGRPGRELDLNKQLGDAVRTFVVKSSPDLSDSKSDLNVSFSDLKQNSDTKFSVHAETGLGKKWAGNGADIEFTLTPSNKATKAKVLTIRAPGAKQ